MPRPAKLSAADVRRIDALRARRFGSRLSVRAIEKLFGVSHTTVWDAIGRKRAYQSVRKAAT